MKLYAIKNDENKNKTLAYLLYYQISKKFYIKMLDNINSNQLPIILKHFYDLGKREVNSYWSFKWVSERIVPPDRQNIANIIKDNNLKKYDEHDLLLLGNGRCSQDDFYIEEIEEDSLLYESINSFDYLIDDCMCLNEKELLVFFRNGKIVKVSLESLVKTEEKINKILNKPNLLSTLEILPGGHEISFCNNIYISNIDLYDNGTNVNLIVDDLIKYISERIVNSTEASEILNCSRQNIDDLVKRKKITPIKTSAKGRLFLKTEIEKRKW